jgi:ER lumen protein retaining receptor
MHAVNYLRFYTLASVALVLAFFFHPSDTWIDVQILVAFTMYIEALGLLPQLWLMRKMYDVEPLTSHYVALLVIARFCRMVFWGVLFWQGEHFLQLFIADVLHGVLCADYMYLWIRKLRSGGRLIYNAPI